MVQTLLCFVFLFDFIVLGAQCFLAQLNVQRAELLERLATAHNFCNLDDEDSYIAASKAVRQVGGQRLSMVWENSFYHF